MAKKTKTRKKSAAETPAGMLDNAVGQIEQAFGPGSIMKLSDATTHKIEGIGTGALSLDHRPQLLVLLPAPGLSASR